MHCLKRGKLRRVFAAVCIATIALSAATAHAFVRSGSASAYGIYVSLDAPGSPASVSPSPLASGNAPPIFMEESSTPSLVSRNAGTFDMRTGPIGVGAYSNVDRTLGPKSASAKVLALDVQMVVNSGEFYSFRLQAGQLGSSLKVSGDAGTFVAFPGFQSSNAVAQIGDEAIYFWPNNPRNTVVWDDGHIRVVQNEFMTFRTSNDLRAVANAIHVYFRNMPTADGPINGEIVIGHSEAMLSAK